MVRGGDKIAKKAREEIVEAMHADDDTPTFARFAEAAEAAIDGMTQFPTDELVKVAELLRRLVASYTEARRDRDARA
jgi:hypothetical protein